MSKEMQTRLARKLILLALLLMGTTLVITPAKTASAAICCSACDADPIPDPCFHVNCNPDC
jgi:hypothetical protein